MNIPDDQKDTAYLIRHAVIMIEGEEIPGFINSGQGWVENPDAVLGTGLSGPRLWKRMYMRPTGEVS